MRRDECSERLRLADAYSHAVTDFNRLLEFLKGLRPSSEPIDWNQAEAARQRSQQAWDALDNHIAAHNCLNLHWSGEYLTEPPPFGDFMKAAAMAALDVILVADDSRCFVDMNDAALAVFERPRDEVLGRRIDEFFSMIEGETVPEAWAGFIAEGVQSGICALTVSGSERRFEYRAKANFAPGLHLSVLREIKG